MLSADGIMKHIALALLLSITLSAADDRSDVDKREVLAALEALRNAVMHPDADALDKILSDDLIYVNSSGTTQNKAELIKERLTGQEVTPKVDFFPDTTVRVYGSLGLVTGKADYWHSNTNVTHTYVLHV